MENPKVFISYSWSSSNHEAWVETLASDLVENGVDVVFDKWDLKEGHDAHAFMERMVTDDDIKKVILICDQVYSEKADGRSGGVGTETQILSPEIYAKQDQNKFVAVVTENDENNTPYVPAYYKSRIYIDFSDVSVHAEGFEKLLRWIYDKPLHKRPELGRKPSFLSDGEGALLLATSSKYRRAIDAIRNERGHAQAAVHEYLSGFSIEMEKLRIGETEGPFDDEVIRSIEAFVPYRNQMVDLFLTLALYQDSEEARVNLHRFFESIMPYMDAPEEASQWRELDYDNFKFIVHELFLYALASFIRHERFETAAYLLENLYYLPYRARYGSDVMASYQEIRQFIESLMIRNDRLGMMRLSLRADLLNQRSAGTGIRFQDLMQADLVLFLRNSLEIGKGERSRWFPETLIYSARERGFEIFARSRSIAYFDKMKVLLGISTKAALEVLLREFAEGERELPRWQFQSIDLEKLMLFDELATKP